MTETGILNREIAAEIAKMGHTDRMIICDAGFALPKELKVIDVSLAKNCPTAVEVLKVILENFSVEKIILSEATHETSPSRFNEFITCFEPPVEFEVIPHQELKRMAGEVKFAVRTGDFTAYSNIVLISAGGPRWYCEK